LRYSAVRRRAAFGETLFWGKSYVEPGPDGCYDEAALRQVKASLLAADLESTLVIPGPGPMKRVRREDLPRIVNRSFETLDGPAAPSVVFTRFAREMARAEGKPHWVEKTPHHLFYADRILRHLPDARFVVMIREPYSFMLSYKHYRGHENTAACSERFVRRYHPLACAVVWRSSSRAAEDLARRMPDQTLVVRLEEVEADPVNLVRRVRSFLLLPEIDNPLPAACKVNSAFGGIEKPSLSGSDIAWMNFVAGPAIERAGYERRLRTGDVYDVCRSIADLPAWVVRWLRDKNQTTHGSLRRHLWGWLVQQRKRLT
jgi:hypothetical protein